MKCMDKHEFEQQNVFGTGAANTAYAKAKGHYGRFDNAPKYIDPRQE